MNLRNNTNKIYKFEALAFRYHPFGKIYSIEELRYIANKIWKHRNKRKHQDLVIVCGQGVLQNGRYLSYYQHTGKHHKVVLARNQRDIVTLVHEIVHAQGYDDHDDRFVKKVLFYLEYLGYNKSELRTIAKEYKII